MFCSDAYPDLSVEQRRSFAAAERRLFVRLIVMGCFGIALLGVTLA